MKTVQTIYGVFDTDQGRLVGIAPQGVPDVTYLAGQDTQTDGVPVTSKINPVTRGNELSPGLFVSRTSVPVVLYEGDSITARAIQAVFPALPTVSTVPSGYNFNGFATWERAFLGCIYDFVNSGVGGETIEQITARMLATDFSPYAAISLMAGMNNVVGSTTADVASDLAMIESVIQRAAAFSKPIRLMTVTPRSTASWTAAERAYVLAFNSGIRAFPAKYPHVFVGDAFSSMQDATAADPTPIAGTVSTDTTHPGKLGSYRIAKYAGANSLRAALRFAGYGRVLEANRPAIDAAYTELLTNTDFKIQTGGLDSSGGLLTVGAVPAGWRIMLNATPTNIKSYFPFYVPEALSQRGMWAASTGYVVGDAVTTAGAAYICLAAHTSAVFATELAAGNWQRVWATDYCWQVEFTADAANDGITIQRQSNLTGTPRDYYRLVCGLATEGEVAKIKQLQPYLAQYSDTTATPNISTGAFHHALYAGSGEAESAIGERIEGVFVTSKQSPFRDYTGGLSSNQAKIEATLSAAGTASVIIWTPSVRKF